MFSKALGEAAKDEDLVRYAFLAIRGYLSAGTMTARLALQRPDGAIRTLLLRGVACAIRERAAEADLGTGNPALLGGVRTHAISGNAQGRGRRAGPLAPVVDRSTISLAAERHDPRGQATTSHLHCAMADTSAALPT